jgi:hypothetical protein
MLTHLPARAVLKPPLTAVYHTTTAPTGCRDSASVTHVLPTSPVCLICYGSRQAQKFSPYSHFQITIDILLPNALPLIPSLHSTPGATTSEPCVVSWVPVSATASSALGHLYCGVETTTMECV